MFFYTRGKYNRPEIKLEIYRVDNKIKNQVWNTFRKYHYLNTELHQASEQYIGIWNGQLVCHTGIIHFPLQKGKKRVHRLVVLPDYQGIGIGTNFIKQVAKMVSKRGFELNLTTTTPSLIYALKKSDNWVLGRFGRSKGTYKRMQELYGMKERHLDKTTSRHRITFSFWYKD